MLSALFNKFTGQEPKKEVEVVQPKLVKVTIIGELGVGKTGLADYTVDTDDPDLAIVAFLALTPGVGEF